MNTKLKALQNTIIFQFVNKASNGMLVDKHEGSIILTTTMADQGKKPRWGLVISVGDKVKAKDEIKEGSYILIDPLQWSIEQKVGQRGLEESVWYTDESKVSAVADTLDGIYDV